MYDMNARQILVAGAVNMFIAVLAGAFGAHALRSWIAPDLLAVWQTGVIYHLAHALGLLAVGLLLERYRSPLVARAGMVMLAGIVLFSGSLYVLAATGVRLLGVVTPFGGLAFLAAWVMLAVGVARYRS